METVFLIYETDSWNSNPVLVAVRKTRKEAIEAVIMNDPNIGVVSNNKDGENEYIVVNEEVVDMLENYGQTQCSDLYRNGVNYNYDIKEVSLNDWEV